MRTVDIHEAEMHLAELVEQAAKGESFIIAKAGRPLVKVSALETPAPAQARRLGFLAENMTIPDDFGRMGSDEIEKLFGGP